MTVKIATDLDVIKHIQSIENDQKEILKILKEFRREFNKYTGESLSFKIEQRNAISDIQAKIKDATLIILKVDTERKVEY